MESYEVKKLIAAWKKSTQDDLDLAHELYGSKRYSYCLFFCQLALEKLLKAIIVKRNLEYPLPVHKLARLAKIARISLSEEQTADLNEITTFNVEARYDILKDQLYKKANEEYTKNYLHISDALFTYFLSLL